MIVFGLRLIRDVTVCLKLAKGSGALCDITTGWLFTRRRGSRNEAESQTDFGRHWQNIRRTSRILNKSNQWVKLELKIPLKIKYEGRARWTFARCRSISVRVKNIDTVAVAVVKSSDPGRAGADTVSGGVFLRTLAAGRSVYVRRSAAWAHSTQSSWLKENNINPVRAPQAPK